MRHGTQQERPPETSGRLSSSQARKEVRTSLIYHGPITAAGARNAEVLLTDAFKNNITDVTLHICSKGGDVSAGVGLYNFVKMIPIDVDTHCFGLCGSIAVSVFLAGRKRSTVPASRFVLHAASHTDGPKKGEVSEDTILLSQIVRENLTWDSKNEKFYFGSTVEKNIPLTVAMQLGIVHEIKPYDIKESDEIINVSIP